MVQIATSNSDTYALTSAGAVWAWGAGGQGELGNRTTPRYASTAVRVHFPAGVRIRSLPNPMPYNAGLAIDSRGRAWGWGNNGGHTLCLRRPRLLVPTRLPFSDVTLATGAGGHSLFDAHGRVFACGEGSDGELGDGSTKDPSKPVRVIGLPRKARIKALVSSWQGSGALLTNGVYYDWGYNAAGQLGDGTTRNSSVPVRVRLPAKVIQVSQGGSLPDNGQTLAILAGGSVWAWGAGRWGQLGDGGSSNSTVPVPVNVPAGVRFVRVSSGGYSCYAIDAFNDLWVWGRNQYGELGKNIPGQAQLRPAVVNVTITQVSATASNVAGLLRSR